MYSQIIYFIIALLLLTLQQPGSKPLHPPAQTILLVLVLLGGFVAACRAAFHPLRKALNEQGADTAAILLYHRIQGRLNVLVILVLVIHVYVLDVKYYLGAVPGFAEFMSISGVIGLGFYLLHLAIIWYLSYPCHEQIHRTSTARGQFVWGNVRFYLALLIPWLLFSLLSDGLQWLPKTFRWVFLRSELGQLLLFGVILGSFLILAPWLMVRLWQCRPIPPIPARAALESFCEQHRFRLGGFLFWPIFAGEAITAGIIGVLPRLRYILMTPGIIRLLDNDELQAVAAHEMGHVRRMHIPFYLVFFLGYSLLAYAWNDLLLLLLLKQPLLLNWALSPDSNQQTLFSVVYSIPIVLLMVLYFRYVFGYFMRNSERQADLYALELVGHPFTLASSLEKIAIASGHTHDLPSWHHFSIRQRIQFLLDSYRHPELRQRHHRKLYTMAVVFFVLAVGLATAGFQFKKTPLAKSWQRQVVFSVLERQLEDWSNHVELMGMAGSVLLEQGRYAEARDLMKKHLERSPNDPQISNNLAWLYATAPPPYADPVAALELALKSVHLDPEPYALDTLAEAYYVNGRYRESLNTIQRAIDMKPDNLKYLLEQQEKFGKALQDVAAPPP